MQIDTDLSIARNRQFAFPSAQSLPASPLPTVALPATTSRSSGSLASYGIAMSVAAAGKRKRPNPHPRDARGARPGRFGGGARSRDSRAASGAPGACGAHVSRVSSLRTGARVCEEFKVAGAVPATWMIRASKGGSESMVFLSCYS